MLSFCLVKSHTQPWRSHAASSRLSGGGEAHPPHAVRAVHRVPGAPFSPAAQQQRGESRGGGAACLHPGSHQTARLLLQVRRHSSHSPPKAHRFLRITSESVKRLFSLPFALAATRARSAPQTSWPSSSWRRICTPATWTTMTPRLRYRVLTANPHSTAIKLLVVPDWFNCFSSCRVFVCEGCREHIWFWSRKLLHPGALPYRQRLEQLRWVSLWRAPPHFEVLHVYDQAEDQCRMMYAVFVFMIQRRSLWEAAPLCLSSWTQTSRWEHIWAPGSMQGWLLFSAGRDLITVSNDDVIRWRRTACRLWRFLHPTLQPLTGSSWRSRSKRGCIPWCLTPCTVCLCGLASHWCCWLRFVDANTRPCTGWGTGGTAVTHLLWTYYCCMKRLQERCHGSLRSLKVCEFKTKTEALKVLKRDMQVIKSPWIYIFIMVYYYLELLFFFYLKCLDRLCACVSYSSPSPSF